MAGTSSKTLKIKLDKPLRYPDLKYLFLRGLIKHERWQRRHHYLKSAAECTSRAVVSLDLCLATVKSVKQAQQIQGIGEEISKILQRLVNDTKISREGPKTFPCVTSASAILVALLGLTEKLRESKDDMLVPEVMLRDKVKQLCEEKLQDSTNTGFCQAWWRLEVLISRGLVKRRSLKKQPVYQLLPEGETLAKQIRDTCANPEDRKTNVVMSDQATDALYTNDNRNQDHGLILLVDQREWGGDAVGLGQLCQMFEDVGVKYRTETLHCGDYQWKWRADQEEITLPVVIERKRADDLAASLKDGRFWKQINNMVKWQETFTQRSVGSSVHYIIEGDLEKYVVRCEDGCQGVGKCGNPTLPVVQTAIKDLEGHPSVCVHKTDTLLNTVNLLAVFSADLGKRIFDGEFDNLRTAGDPDHNANSAQEEKSPAVISDMSDQGLTSIQQPIQIKSDTEDSDSDAEIVLLSAGKPGSKCVRQTDDDCVNNNNTSLSSTCRTPTREAEWGETYCTGDPSCEVNPAAVKRKLQDIDDNSQPKSPGGKVYLMKKFHKPKPTPDEANTVSKSSDNELIQKGGTDKQLGSSARCPPGDDMIRGYNSVSAAGWASFLDEDTLPDL